MTTRTPAPAGPAQPPPRHPPGSRHGSSGTYRGGVRVSHTDRRPPRGRGSKCREGVKSRPPPPPPSELVGGLGRAAPPLRPAGAAQPPCPGSRYPAGGGGARQRPLEPGGGARRVEGGKRPAGDTPRPQPGGRLRGKRNQKGGRRRRRRRGGQGLPAARLAPPLSAEAERGGGGGGRAG